MVRWLRRACGAAAAWALLAAGAAAEGAAVNVELNLMASAERNLAANGQVGLYDLSRCKASFATQGSTEVKAQLTVEAVVADAVLFDIPKAWVKARLGEFRLTVGKTRVSWGEGYMFNAGDVVFNGAGADLGAEDLRDNNAWLVGGYLPLGDFSFVELVALPPDLPLKAYQLKAYNPAAPTPVLRGLDAGSAGGRLYAKAGGLKLEAGYLFDGLDGLNKPYLSLQGHLGADWHLSSGIAVPANDAWNAATLGTWQISAGLLYQLPLGGNDDEADQAPASGSLDFRLEALVKPYGEWVARTLPAQAFDPLDASGQASPYALSVFPQISWKSDTLFAYLRGLWSPVDGSLYAGAGLQWAPLQGFKIMAGFACQIGSAGDLYGWDRDRGWQFGLGSQVNF